MAEKLELLISAKNTADAALKDARTDVRNLEKSLRKASDALDETGQGKAKVESLQRSLDRARREAKTFAAESKDAANAVEQLGREADQAGRRFGRFRRDSQTAGAAVNKSTRGMAGGFAVMGGSAMAAGAAVAAVGVAAVLTGQKLWGLTGMIGALEKSQNKSAVVFGKQTKMMRAWAREQDGNFGASTQDVMDYAASIQDLLVPMKFTRTEATGMTKGLAELVPALTAWDKQGRSSAEITDILTSAIMGEREALKGLGIGISQDAVDAQMDLLDSQGKLTGKTKEQAQAMATLDLIYAKSTDAQKTYADNTDTVARRTERLKSDVTNLRDQGLRTLLGVWRGASRAFRAAGFGGGIRDFTAWLKANRKGIEGMLLGIASGFVRAGAIVMKIQSGWIRGMGWIVTGIAKVLEVAALLDPRLQGTADKASGVAETFAGLADAEAEAADKAWRLADSLSDQADKAGRAQRETERFGKALRDIPATVRTKIETTYENTSSAVPWYQLGLPDPSTTRKRNRKQGDTHSPRSRGMVPGVLGTAHARLSAGIAGSQRITSGLRSHDLGSPGSDHALGRAMDVTGPGLGLYAARVRQAGGYAAFHGSGPDRHLHTVPAAGVTEVHHHYQAVVNNPTSTVDVKAVFRQLEAEAAADARTRGKGWPHG